VSLPRPTGNPRGGWISSWLDGSGAPTHVLGGVHALPLSSANAGVGIGAGPAWSTSPVLGSRFPGPMHKRRNGRQVSRRLARFVPWEARCRDPAVVYQQPPVVHRTQFGDRRRSLPRTRRGYRHRGRPVSTPECVSGCRLAVERFALGPAGRPLGDSGTGHPLGGGCVGRGPDEVGMLTVTWRCRAWWRAGS
jgi:hypothetical protein